MDLNWIFWEMLSWEAMKTISQKSWLDMDSTKDLTKKALPILLWALKDNSKNPLKSLWLEEAVKWNDWSILSNMSKISLEDGSKILWHIFWDEKEKVEEKIWSKKLLSALAPLVMWALWKANSESWLDAKSLLASDGVAMKLAKSFLDKDWDGDVKDDLLTMIINFVKKLMWFSKK